MKKNTLRSLFALLTALVMAACLLTGCGAADTEPVEAQEDAETIQVYLWTTSLYDTYAPYIQAQLPDVNIEFIVGNNDLDFYKFLQQNGGLPDIITCCRFSLHDAAPLKDSLMDLSTTNEAGAVYNTYLNSFKNEDGSVNWLPVCADAHGFVVNRSLFAQYDIPLPTDYASFVSACQAFEKVGIRGFTADYAYDYTCMETLQGLSAAELTTVDGRKWRTAYSDPANTTRVGLDDTIWPGAFERMAQFIQDTHLTADDLAQTYDDVMDLFRNGEVAMYFGSSAGVKMFQDEGIDTTFLPFFSQNGEQWIMTTPYFQVALNRGLEQDTARREKAMKVLDVMLGGTEPDRLGRAGHSELQPGRPPAPDRYHEGRPLCGGREPHVHPHRLQRFLCHLPGCGLPDDRRQAHGSAGLSGVQCPASCGRGACCGRGRADLREGLFQRVPQRRRHCLLLRHGEHPARPLRH